MIGDFWFVRSNFIMDHITKAQDRVQWFSSAPLGTEVGAPLMLSVFSPVAIAAADSSVGPASTDMAAHAMLQAYAEAARCNPDSNNPPWNPRLLRWGMDHPPSSQRTATLAAPTKPHNGHRGTKLARAVATDK